jgi:hypothetical protein
LSIKLRRIMAGWNGMNDFLFGGIGIFEDALKNY